MLGKKILVIVGVLIASGIAILAWMLVTLYLHNWIIPGVTLDRFDKEWELEKDILLFITSAIFFVVGIKLFLKHAANRKTSSLLLAIYNTVYGTSFLTEGFGNILIFTDLLNHVLQNLTFFLFTLATVFLYFFLLELFSESFTHKKNFLAHAIFLPIMFLACTVIILAPLIDIVDEFMSISLGMALIATLFLAIWELKVVNVLRRKSGDDITRNGLLMIELSAIALIALIVSFIMKALNVSGLFDIILPAVSVAMTVFTYWGFVYPSTKRAGEQKRPLDTSPQR